jgi:hypothetical protein
VEKISTIQAFENEIFKEQKLTKARRPLFRLPDDHPSRSGQVRNSGNPLN